LPSPGLGSVFLGWMARRFGSIFVLALAQNAEGRSPYDSEPFATARMVADEKIHREVVRGLAARGRDGCPARSAPPSSAPTTASSPTSLS
jgi:transposase